MVVIGYSNPTRRDGSQINWNRGGRGGSRKPTPPPETSIEERNRIFDAYRSGQISQAEAIGKISGANARASFEAKVSAENIAKAQAERQAKAEQARIENKKRLLIAAGARKNTYSSRDIRTGNILKITEIKKGADKIRTVYDTVTGQVRTNVYGTGKGGGSVRLKSGVSSFNVVAPQYEETINSVKITQSNNPNKVRVTFPNGQVVDINKFGKVVVGSNLAGNKYIFENGKVIAINGKSTGARQEYEPVLSVEAVEQPKGKVARIIKKLNDSQKVRATTSIRTKQAKLKNELSLLGLTTATTIIGGVTAFVALPKVVVNLIKNPSQIKKIPGAIFRGGQNFGQLMRVSPTEFLGVVAGEVILFKGTSSSLKAVGKVSTKVKNIVKPVLNKADKTRFSVNGNTIRLAGGTASTAESLARQAARAGKKARPVTALSDDIFGLIRNRNKRVVSKPIPGEQLLSKSTKKLLKKFDARLTSKSEIAKLDRLIRIETKGRGSLLERVTYADPAGRVRTSRLGINSQKDASLIDILAGDYTFRTNKPQIFVFDDIAIEAFPKSLRGVARKFKTGRTLTQSEADALLRFQLKKSGKFKPIGALSRESEIVLAPGEVIKKVRRVGYVAVKGKRVPVTLVRVVKSGGQLKTLLNKFNRATISKAELKKLERLLQKTSGFKNKFYRANAGSPKARLPGIVGARRGIKTARRTTIQRRAVRKPIRTRGGSGKITRRTTIQRPIRGTRPTKITRRTLTPPRPGRTTRTPPRTIRNPPRPPRITRGLTPPRPPVTFMKKQFTKSKLQKPQQTYYVVEKVRGKFKKLYPKPLTAKDAKDYAVYSIDNRLSKTAFFIPLGKSKNIIRPPKQIQNYYVKNAKKVRPYKIRFGKKKQLVNGFIEKRKYFQDTAGEKSQAARLRMIARSRKVMPKRKITSAQRKILIARLKLARAARMRNLRKRK